MAGKLLPQKQAASRAHPFTSILGREKEGHLRASQPWEAARVQCGVSLPEAKLISLAQFDCTNSLPVSQGAERPPVSGREWVVRQKWFCPLRGSSSSHVCRRPKSDLEGAKGSGLEFSSLSSKTKSCISSWLCPPQEDSQLLPQHP